ncbi:hypothetical protein B0H10DRAFT_2024097 [Mycena sp. CBHHK59/15]|nr:hypothetical protein B0H10DRAFT_2024097 [Mycena sp. CBHHK59/15]
MCAQAAEAGGRTDNAREHPHPRGHTPTDGEAAYVVGAGAVYDMRGLAANSIRGAQVVSHKEHVVGAGFDALIFGGRPMRVARTPYIDDWRTTGRKNKGPLIQEHPEACTRTRRARGGGTGTSGPRCVQFFPEIRRQQFLSICKQASKICDENLRR